MGVPPADRCLHDLAQLAKMKAPGVHELTPDHRLDVEQDVAELHGGRFFPGHAAIMTGFADGRQSSLRMTNDHKITSVSPRSDCRSDRSFLCIAFADAASQVPWPNHVPAPLFDWHRLPRIGSRRKHASSSRRFVVVVASMAMSSLSCHALHTTTDDSARRGGTARDEVRGIVLAGCTIFGHAVASHAR
jgi:hypothetical protein